MPKPTHPDHPNLTIVEHPLLLRALTILRDRETPHGRFRTTLRQVASILAYEALRGVTVRPVSVQTPLEETTGHVLDEEVIVVPILRAGLGLVDGIVEFVPEARVGHLGLQRDEDTHRPTAYYHKVPGGLANARVFVVDPMLATGGSLTEALRRLKKAGAERITFVCLVAAPEGVQRIAEEHPDVPLVTAALDRELDEHAYIRPGLGDAGDRTFGT